MHFTKNLVENSNKSVGNAIIKFTKFARVKNLCIFFLILLLHTRVEYIGLRGGEMNSARSENGVELTECTLLTTIANIYLGWLLFLFSSSGLRLEITRARLYITLIYNVCLQKMTFFLPRFRSAHFFLRFFALCENNEEFLVFTFSSSCKSSTFISFRVPGFIYFDPTNSDS